MVSEEPPSFEEQLDLLDKVFNDNIDEIDVVALFADAEIDLSAFLLYVELQMERQQRSDKSAFMFEGSLEVLFEAELDLLNDEDVLRYLQAEGINCEQFVSRALHLIEGRPLSN